MLQLFVANFGFNVQDEDLRDFFTPYGEVISAEVVTDRFTGTSRGCGYVVMKEKKAAKKAIAALQNFQVDRNIMTIKEAKAVSC
ncbi:MAG: RNA-binding protein [Chitinophagaceae bacterium]|nr:RNA-binding protein [Chitinophagaceae bacterium]